MDVELLSMLANVQEIRGLAATTDGRVMLVPTSLVFQSHRQYGSAAGRARERQVVAMRIGQDLAPVSVHHEEIGNLHDLLFRA